VQSGKCASIALIISDQPAKACCPGKGTFDHPASWQQDKALLRLRQFDHHQLNAVRLCRRCGVGTVVAGINEGDIDTVAGGVLHRLRQPPDLGAVIGIGRRDMQSQQMTKGVDRHVQLRAALAFGTVVACPWAAFRRRAQGAAVEDSRGRLRGPPGQLAQHRTQVLGQHLEAAGGQPALRLLVDRRPWRQVIGHPPPWRTGLDDVAQAVEDLAQGVLTLASLLAYQRQVGRNQRPLFIADVRGVALPGICHRPQLGVYSAPSP
jgi:hypothetical protein